jgi:MGT family glycosyltransferase
VVQVPFYSHSAAGMRLAGVLMDKGHEVTAWGPDRHRKEIETLGATFELHEPTMPRTAGLGFPMELLETTEQLAEGLVEQFFEYEIELVVHDSQAPWARVAGDYLGLPRIVAHPMFPIVAPYAKPSRADPFLEPPSDEEAMARFRASWRSIARRWGVEIEDDQRAIHSPAPHMLAFTTETIVGDSELPPTWTFVGPLMSPPPPTVEPTGRPLVYVCFGTAYNARPEAFRAVISALATEPVDVLVSTGRGKWMSAAKLRPLPENVTVRRFVPAREVLSRASVHITHAGCNSVHETLLAGVPMVCMPQAFDQFPLSRAVQVLGAGLVAEEDPFEIREAVRLLLASDKPRSRARELGEHLATYDGAGRLEALVERVLGEHSLLSGSGDGLDRAFRGPAPGSRVP